MANTKRRYLVYLHRPVFGCGGNEPLAIVTASTPEGAVTKARRHLHFTGPTVSASTVLCMPSSLRYACRCYYAVSERRANARDWGLVQGEHLWGTKNKVID